MDFTMDRINVTCETLKKTIVTHSLPLEYELTESGYKTSDTPPADGWRPHTPGMLFTDEDTHYWLRMRLPAVAAQPGCELRLRMRNGREDWAVAHNPQFTVYINGVTTQALDTFHSWLPVAFDTAQEVFIYMYTGIGLFGGNFECDFYLDTADLRTEALYYDLHVPYQAAQTLGEQDTDAIHIRDELDKALNLLDLREIGSEAFYRSVQDARAMLKTAFYEKDCPRALGRMSCVGNTHLDIAWLWSVAQTREKVQRSFATVLNLMDRYPEYIFFSDQPILYQFIRENDPAMYARIKQRMAEGRWDAEGAMWLEADTNITGGESLIRQLIYGKRFLKEELGVDSRVLWMFDVFGFTGALPQILRKCGVTRFFSPKLTWNESNFQPDDLFWWEGIDGSRVFAMLNGCWGVDLDPERSRRNWQIFKNKSLTDTQLLTFGHGDGGGGPTYEMLENYDRLKYGLPGIPKMEMARMSDTFDRIEQDFHERTAALRHVPVWNGELYLELHRGTYTSIGKNKKNNRRCEQLLQTVESLCVTDQVLRGGEYPAGLLEKHWHTLLLNQFHDVLPGTSVQKVYDVTDAEYAEVMESGSRLIADRLAGIRSELRTAGGVFVFNPAPFAFTGTVEADGVRYHAENVPAHGWKVVPAVPAENRVTVQERCIENELLRVAFDEKYHIVSIWDKQNGREVLAPGAAGNRLEVYEDYPRDYDAWEISSYYDRKMWVADDVSRVTPLADGIRVERRYGHSVITQDIRLRTGSGRVDFETTVDWHEDHVLLKAAFPVDVHATQGTCGIQFGSIERPTHRNTSWDAAKFEVCAHRWVDLSEGNYGVSLLDDCKYGHSLDGNVLRISLLKAATSPYPEADRGLHTFTYALYPHAGDHRQGGTVREAYALDLPPVAFVTGAADGTLPEEYAPVLCTEPNIVIETIKAAERENAVILRLYDAHNQKISAVLRPGFAFREAYICDMLEQNEQALEVTGGCVTVPVKNFEIVTVKFVL